MTDHRLGRTVHGVQEFLGGGALLEGVVKELQVEEEASALTTLCRDSAEQT